MLARLSLLVVLAFALAPLASSQEALRLYPNPVRAGGAVTVEVAGAEGATAEVVTALGRRADLDGPLAAGFYLVRVRTADGRVQAAPLTVVRPARVRLHLRESGADSEAASGARGHKAGPRHVFIHVIGDSHAAGKGDPVASCDLRPGVAPKGWVFRRSFEDFVPACSPEADKLYNGSIFPSLVDEVYERLGLTPLVVFYTVKGSRVGPEGEDNDVHWFPGDDDEPASEYYTQSRLVFRRAVNIAEEQFGAAPDTLAMIVSVGSVDARLYEEGGAPDPVSEFLPRFSVLHDSLSASGVPTYYFEVSTVPGKPEFNAVVPAFRESMDAVVPVDRTAIYSDDVWDAHHENASPNDPALWYADRAGHLGSLGLDLLGIRLAELIEFEQRVRRRRHVVCEPGARCASGVRR